MALFDYLFAVIPMLGVLILVHELGHFLVAKACGVRVLKFAIGFGSPIGFGRYRMRWERGGTEYVIGWFPLGGFVRMLGEQVPGEDEAPGVVPPDAAPDEFLDAKPVWQKLAIVFAGPAANLLLPIVCFMGILWFGVPKATPVIGAVEIGSPAESAGLEPGDRVLAIAGEPVAWWDELDEAVRAQRDGFVRLDIERAGEPAAVDVRVETRKGIDDFGGVVSEGWIGIGSRRLPGLIGVPHGDSPAARAGLRSGDWVVAVDDTEIETWEDLAAAQAKAGTMAIWHVKRALPEAEPVASAAPSAPRFEEVEIRVPKAADLDALGLVPATILIASVSDDFPAQAAGLARGDLILEVDGRPVGSFDTFQNLVRTSGGRPLEITYARSGRVSEVTVAPKEGTLPNPLGIDGMDEKTWLIGIRYSPATLPGAVELDRVRNPLVALPRSVDMTVDATVRFLDGFGKFFTGEVGTDKISGPIGIAEIARKSLDIGFMMYIQVLILISINLGILNLLPIPILDGGQAVLYALEGIKRAPLSVRSREIAAQIGFAMIVLIMGLAFWNDLSRKWASFVEWISGSL